MIAQSPTPPPTGATTRIEINFGHTFSVLGIKDGFYQHVVSTEGHDLPIQVGIGPASETDFTLSLKSLDRLRKALKENGMEWQIRHGVYLAFHDAIGISVFNS